MIFNMAKKGPKHCHKTRQVRTTGFCPKGQLDGNSGRECFALYLNRQTDRQQARKQTDRQISKHTDRQTDRQIDRQTERNTHRQTETD